MIPPDEVIDQTTMYCRRCSYALDGLTEQRCPECGREFDPNKPKTFRRKPRTRPWLAGVLTLAFILGACATGWLYSRRPQPAPGMVRVRFDPNAKSKGITSWTALFPSRVQPDGSVHYMAICNIQVGKRVIARFEDGPTLFQVFLRDGNDDRLNVDVIEPDETKQPFTLVRDQPVTVEVGGLTYRLAYCSSDVSATQPAIHSYATIFIYHEP